MYSIFVTINVNESDVDAFITASYGDAQGSVRDEPDCFRFDIHRDASLETRFYLYEVYADEAAFQQHLETPHFLKWQAEVESLFASEPIIVPMVTLFPSDSGWISQKPGLLGS
jgi:autoinducer 2-degrading protein